MRQGSTAWLLTMAACGSSSAAHSDASGDGTGSSDASSGGTRALGTVGAAMDISCTGSAPAGATSKRVTVSGCPGIENETLNAILAIVAPTGTSKGTIVHFS